MADFWGIRARPWRVPHVVVDLMLFRQCRWVPFVKVLLQSEGKARLVCLPGVDHELSRHLVLLVLPWASHVSVQLSQALFARVICIE